MIFTNIEADEFVILKIPNKKNVSLFEVGYTYNHQCKVLQSFKLSD